jgi:hypothetical protein
MNIIQRSPTRLTLKQHLLGVWCLAGFSVLLGLFLFISYQFPMDFLGLGCIVAGAMIKGLTPIETCIFDQQQQMMTLTHHHGLSRRIHRYQMSNITAVTVERRVLYKTHFYSVRLRLYPEKFLNLTQFPTTDCQQQQELAVTIRRFLNLA